MIDHLALLPAYTAAATAVLVLLADLVAPGRRGWPTSALLVGGLATAAACLLAVRDGPRRTFCVAPRACSFEWAERSTMVGLLFVAITLVVLGLSTPLWRSAGGAAPAGEYCFLLACSMTGGVVLGAAGDLITLVVALETLALPLYVLVGLRQRSVVAAEAAATFFVVSVVATAVTLLGAGLLYASTGAVHINMLADMVTSSGSPTAQLAPVAVVLVLSGLAVKVAAVPFHVWAPSTYDGTSLPVAAYLSTASKLGGVVAVLTVTVTAFRPWLHVTGVFFAVVATLTMTVGNLAALRQRRMVRLLAWSSVAQAGYLLAPLAMAAAATGRSPSSLAVQSAAVLAYTVLFVIVELLAFAVVVALRADADGGSLADYAGAARARPGVAVVLVLALAGLAGLPPGLAGLFAKVVVVRALVGGGAGWLAVVVALNTVVGLAYYVRAVGALFGASPAGGGGAAGGPVPGGVGVADWPRPPASVVVALVAVTTIAVVVGFAPQLVL